MRTVDLASWVLSQDLPGYSPEVLPSEGISVGGANSPKQSWGQSHRISGHPWYRSTYQHPGALLHFGEDGGGEGTIQIKAPTLDDLWTKEGMLALGVSALVGYQTGSMIGAATAAYMASVILLKESTNRVQATAVGSLAGYLGMSLARAGGASYRTLRGRRRSSRKSK